MIRDVPEIRGDGRYSLLKFAVNDIGEYLIMLMTVCTKPSVGGNAVLVEDTERTEGLVARITIAKVYLIVSLGAIDRCHICPNLANANVWNVFNQPWSAWPRSWLRRGVI